MVGSIAREDAELWRLFRAIVAEENDKAVRMLDKTPELASRSVEVGATRKRATGYFVDAIGHHLYAGDTALHVAAAAYNRDIVQVLIELAANPHAKNRRGAEPLHYAADGMPGSHHWNPVAQAEVIELLVRSGADPNAVNKNGVAPLHRAVRTRSAAAVRALLANGADPLKKNGNGSTPLDLAARNTGRGGSGSDEARRQQAEILPLLTEGQ